MDGRRPAPAGCAGRWVRDRRSHDTHALFWFDHTTLVGLLEPMRVEDEFQRRGLTRMLLTNGLDRLARKGALRLKVGFETDAARNLYLGAGFVQKSIDRLLIRPAPHEPCGQ
jgi:GNAT superfamily N-acetyltransferase